MSVWGKAAGAVAGGINDAERERERRELATLQHGGLLAHLSEQGYGLGEAPSDPGMDILSGAGVDQAVTAATGGLGIPAIGSGHAAAKDTRYETVAPGKRGLYRDKTRTPEARDLRKRAATAAAYRGAGLSEGEALAASLNPSLADNFVATPRERSRRGIERRTVELMASPEMVAEYPSARERALAAARQARSEYGETTSPDPREVHATNRRFDVAHPLPTRTKATTGESAGHRSTRQGLSAVRGQLNEANQSLRSMDRSAPPLVQFPGLATGSHADSVAAGEFSTRRGAMQERADSLRGVSDRMASELTREGRSASTASSASGASRDDYNREAALYKQAVATIRERYSGKEATRRIQAVTDRYNERVGALAGGHR